MIVEYVPRTEASVFLEKIKSIAMGLRGGEKAAADCFLTITYEFAHG